MSSQDFTDIAVGDRVQITGGTHKEYKPDYERPFWVEVDGYGIAYYCHDQQWSQIEKIVKP